MPSLADLPAGECIIKSLHDAHGFLTGLHIDRADPRVLITAALLDEIADHPSPHAWLDVAGCTTYDGALLKIRADNRTVIYRIVEYIPRVRTYIGEWPD